MAVKIGHAVVDENGKSIGGRAGDQTGKELRIDRWYFRPWNVLLICKDKELAKKASEYMQQICEDSGYGYDQGDRVTGYNAIMKNGGKVKGAVGEFDCSSLVSACYKLAGLDVSVSNTTRTMKNAFSKTGLFEVYTDNAHLNTDSYARVGAIYLREGNHVIMALENGVTRLNPYPEPAGSIKKGLSGNGVKWLQYELAEAGYNVKIDGVFGPKTEDALKDFQKVCRIAIDGVAGPVTKKQLKLN